MGLCLYINKIKIICSVIFSFTLIVLFSGQTIGQKPRPILKNVPIPSVNRIFKSNPSESNGPNLPNRNTMPADIILPFQDPVTSYPAKSELITPARNKIPQSKGDTSCFNF